MHLGWILASGVALLAMAVLPRLLADRPMSLPTLYVGFGCLVFWAVDPLRGPQPLVDAMDTSVVLYGSEIVVIVSLATVGLSIERRPGLVAWSSVWRLLVLTMPMSIAGAALLGSAMLGLTVPAALLLGAVLAPTDPVLADDVQVSAPGEHHDRDEVRFTLTAEAGLNDSLAFPFTYLAIAASATSIGDAWGDWLLTDVIYRLVVGTVAGLVLGRILTHFVRRWKVAIARSGGAGVFVLGATLVVYGVTELVEGYGFLAVFVAAMSRHDEVEELRQSLHGFSEQFESLLVAIALVGLGALVAEGILNSVSLEIAVVAALLVLVVRPLAGWAGLMGSKPRRRERMAIAFLGIKGLGSIYYLAYASANGQFDADALEVIWATVTLTILVSIVVHGVSAPWIMNRIDETATTNRTTDTNQTAATK